MNAVDTNILVYAIDQHEPEKRASAQALLRDLGNSGDRPLLLWQVACEFVACLRRWESKSRIEPHEVQLYLEHFQQSLPLILPTEQVLGLSIDFHDRYSLSHWDSLLIAACADAGVDTLYSEDMQSGATYGQVRVVNPFKSDSAIG